MGEVLIRSRGVGNKIKKLISRGLYLAPESIAASSTILLLMVEHLNISNNCLTLYGGEND